jgi:hypothetical protein
MATAAPGTAAGSGSAISYQYAWEIRRPQAAIRARFSLRHLDAVTVAYEITIDDPKIFTRTWSQEFRMKLHPTWKLLEQVCEENNRCKAGKCAHPESQKTK